MLAEFQAPWRRIAILTGLGASVGWATAFIQALPRLTAGPLCTTRDDVFALAGHCPACFVAAGLSLAFLGSVLMARGQNAQAPPRSTV